MLVRTLVSTLYLGLMIIAQSYAEPPKKIKVQENSFLLHTVSKYVLVDYAKGLLNDVEILGEANKNLWINKSSHATVAILLYEFASGNGPSTRYFYEEHPFTQQVMVGPGMRYVMHQYVNEGQKPLSNIRYQFSPIYIPFKPSIWSFSVRQHCKTFSEKNLSQLMLGSFNASVEKIGDVHLVHLWNTTSRKSLFLGLGKRIQRPLPFGNIDQHLYFTLTDEQVKALSAAYHP